MGEFLEQKLEQLAPELKMQAEKLNRLGFEVDEECRVKSEAFLEQVPAKEIAADLTLAKKLKVKHARSTESSSEKKANKSIGETLEVAKTLGVDGHWFGGRFVAVRSSEYDDYCGNKVDNLIFDTVTREPLAAIDATTNQAEKLKNKAEIIKKVMNGAEVKYGYSLEKTEDAPGYKAVKMAGQKLPYFMISFSSEDLENIARDLVEGVESEELAEASRRLLRELKQQAEIFSKHPSVKPEIKAAYGRFLKIFEGLTK